ncbi:MAG: hypothetical protein H7338_20305 [Candidatus Sericytochromatia bacterium]|nr:hypothetical protein [Candidatus Sericytochromatia bacterium]
MTDALTVRPTEPVTQVPPASSSKGPAQAATPTDPPTAAAFKTDSLQVPKGQIGLASQPAALFQDPPGKAAKPKSDHPWALRSLTARFTPMRVVYGNSTIRFQQPGYGTDVTIKDVQARDRTSFEYLYTMPNGWPQLDEPQSSVGVAGTFANGFGVELNLKHNKYIVADRSQSAQFDGMINGQDVHGQKPLGDFVGQYEISGGMNQVSILGTKSLSLPALSPKDRFSLVLKAGGGPIVTYTNSRLKRPDGQFEQGPQNYHVGGFSALGETELRYEVRKRVVVSASNSISYCNITSSQLAGGGKATHSLWASQVAVGVGYTFNFKDKHAPIDPATQPSP